MINTQYTETLATYEWAFKILDGDRIPYMKQTDLESFNEVAVVPFFGLQVQHEPLYLMRDNKDLNDQPNKEALVREWGKALKRKVEGWIDPNREIPNQREHVRLKVLDLAHAMEFEVDGLLDGHEWINAGNGQHLHRSLFRILGWRRD